MSAVMGVAVLMCVASVVLLVVARRVCSRALELAARVDAEWQAVHTYVSADRAITRQDVLFRSTGGGQR